MPLPEKGQRTRGAAGNCEIKVFKLSRVESPCLVNLENKYKGRVEGNKPQGKHKH